MEDFSCGLWLPCNQSLMPHSNNHLKRVVCLIDDRMHKDLSKWSNKSGLGLGREMVHRTFGRHVANKKATLREPNH